MYLFSSKLSSVVSEFGDVLASDVSEFVVMLASDVGIFGDVILASYVEEAVCVLLNRSEKDN